MSVEPQRAFRFGLQLMDGDRDQLRAAARTAEEAGFDVLLVGDHVGTGWAPLPILADLAAVTHRIRLGTLVLNNDLRHPVLLAQELTTLDHISSGRVELGLGAGHSWPEYEAMGRPFDTAAVRKARLAESVEVLRPLLDGRQVDWTSRHYVLKGGKVRRSLQDRLPIHVAGNGHALLTHAARHADIVGLSGLGRTLPDGQRHVARFEPARLDEQVSVIRAAVRDSGAMPELSALVQRVEVTSRRRAVAREFAQRIEGLAAADALETPFLALGTHAEIAHQVLTARQRWGISYFVVRDAAAFVPVMQRLRGMDPVESQDPRSSHS